jgi:hypothetical protein
LKKYCKVFYRKHVLVSKDHGKYAINRTVIPILETTASDGKKYPTQFYNLDAVIAAGYRVYSRKATQFRI